MGVGVRREGWALHNLFSLSLIKGKKREKNECGNAGYGRRTAAPCFSRVAFCHWTQWSEVSSSLRSRWGKEAWRRVAEAAQQVCESGELNLGGRHLLTPSPTAVFSSHITPESGIAWRAGEVKVSQPHGARHWAGQRWVVTLQQHCLSSFSSKNARKKPLLLQTM